jgi:excinuclease Cho
VAAEPLQDLREMAKQLPPAPGVYTFHGESPLPLYIGKSVNIRGRVLNHIRTPDEARLLSLTRRFSYVRTAGDIGAQLLEAQQVKLLQPLFNKRLRRNKRLCTITLQAGELRITDVHDAGDAASFGLYPSRFAAVEALREIADTHLLCYSRLGIEKLPAGRPCFRHALKRCAGVCCGAEPDDDHRQRLLAALIDRHVHAWPYPGAVGIVEKSDELQQIHVVRNWHYLGTADTLAKARKLDQLSASFDRDCYRILVRPLITGAAEIREL